MEAMLRVEPQVLETLLREPVWAGALRGGPRPSNEEAKPASERWRRRWRLFESWCWHWAEEQISIRWARARGQELLITGIKLAPAPLSPEPFRFDFQPWRAHQEDWRSYKARLTKSFTERRASYRTQVEAAAHRAGYLRTPEVRSDKQFYWLARRHLHGESYIDMARHGVGLTPKQISVAVRRLARFIDLRLEPRPRRKH